MQDMIKVRTQVCWSYRGSVYQLSDNRAYPCILRSCIALIDVSEAAKWYGFLKAIIIYISKSRLNFAYEIIFNWSAKPERCRWFEWGFLHDASYWTAPDVVSTKESQNSCNSWNIHSTFLCDFHTYGTRMTDSCIWVKCTESSFEPFLL